MSSRMYCRDSAGDRAAAVKLAQAFSTATGGGAVDVSVRQDAPDAVELGAIDARTARRLIGALRF
ncbi:hypothetical protein AB0N60_11010 [Streptomyces microflavus]|uniref:hypothetical protein n=1 Tax=Streptomyces microflavus TaxID=1919 RepID=UPI00332F9793